MSKWNNLLVYDLRCGKEGISDGSALLPDTALAFGGCQGGGCGSSGSCGSALGVVNAEGVLVIQERDWNRGQLVCSHLLDLCSHILKLNTTR